ncbi:Retrovirus-related Pol polyprotein from transposon [Dictyocoela muelleri]|nr:Retrovirus-related Pol polyprotein from transposon [Dictyocoela muelleri]
MKPIIVNKNFKVPLKVRKNVLEHLKRLESSKIICRSESTYSFPAFIIPKKNNKILLVVGYRELNKHTLTKSYSFPNLYEEFIDLHGPKIFSQLDLFKGIAISLLIIKTLLRLHLQY